MATAYSYLRLSSKRQEHGDSLRRQAEMRDRYLARHSEPTLSDEAFEDRGISAFTGANSEQGNLMVTLSLY
jgi:hypothetical protein